MSGPEPPSLSVTPADPCSGDGAELVAELNAFIARVYPEDEEEGDLPVDSAVIAAQGTFLLARLDGAAAGCGALMPLQEPHAMEAIRMYVRSQFRGRGVADAVLAELEAIARSRGADRLMLRCGPRQPQALRMYARNGYGPRGAFGHHREHVLNIFLEKTLA